MRLSPPLRLALAAAALAAADLVASAPVTAQPALRPERPGLGVGTAVVEAGRVQVEAGLPHGAEAGDGVTWTFPALVRAGLGRGVELRLSSPVVHLTADAEAADAALGAKVRVGRQRGIRPALAAVFGVVAPTGSGAFGRRRVGAGAEGVLAWAAEGGAGSASVSVSGGVVPDGRVGHAGRAALFAALARPLGRALRTAPYVEVGVELRTERVAHLGAGVSVRPHARLQLDAFARRSWRAGASAWVWGGGVATVW